MPEADITVDPDLVARLVQDQVGDELAHLRDYEPTLVATGWDNAVFRLGPHHAARMPVRDLAGELAQKETRWVGPASAGLRAQGINAPVPVFVGSPTEGYPYVWSIVPWWDGYLADDLPTGQRAGLELGIARALLALHSPAPADAPVNPLRGCPLRDRHESVQSRLSHLAGQLDATKLATLSRVWEQGVTVPAWPGTPRWVHGDFHPRNLLQTHGDLIAVLDWGDMGAGDPAVDLATAWLTLPAQGREEFWRRLDERGDYDPAIRDRAAAWAVSMVVALLCDPPSHRPFARVIQDGLEQLGAGRVPTSADARGGLEASLLDPSQYRVEVDGEVFEVTVSEGGTVRDYLWVEGSHHGDYGFGGKLHVPEGQALPHTDDEEEIRSFLEAVDPVTKFLE